MILNQSFVALSATVSSLSNGLSRGQLYFSGLARQGWFCLQLPRRSRGNYNEYDVAGLTFPSEMI